MSTPRTDKEVYDSQPGNPMCPEGKFVVGVEFARNLEKENQLLREGFLLAYARCHPMQPPEVEAAFKAIIAHLTTLAK